MTRALIMLIGTGKDNWSMKCNLPSRRNRALTLIEVLVLLAGVFIIFMVVIPAFFTPLSRSKAKATRIQCATNLKQVGLAFRIWEGDNGDHFPMTATNATGGLMFSNVSSAPVYFQAMSNELNNPKVLRCPEDNHGTWATNWNSDFHAFNLSYFIGCDANDKSPQSLLSGDDNFTNGTPVVNGILYVTTNSSVGWTPKRHNGSGNVGLADGSVQQWSSRALQSGMANTGFATNCLLMP